MRLRVCSDLNSIPRKKENLEISFYLHIIKQRNLFINTLFYCTDAIESKFTYILFYNVFIIKVIVSKVTS